MPADLRAVEREPLDFLAGERFLLADVLRLAADLAREVAFFADFLAEPEERFREDAEPDAFLVAFFAVDFAVRTAFFAVDFAARVAFLAVFFATFVALAVVDLDADFLRVVPEREVLDFEAVARFLPADDERFFAPPDLRAELVLRDFDAVLFFAREGELFLVAAMRGLNHTQRTQMKG